MKIDRKWLNIILPLAFVLMCVLFVVLHLFDGSQIWYYVGATRIHSVICGILLPAQETFSDFQTYTNAYNRLWAIWGIGYAFFPLLSLVLAANNKKVPAIIFAGITMVLSLFFGVRAVSGYWPNVRWPQYVGWLLFIIAGVLILLNALGCLKNKKLTVIFFVVLSFISVVLFGVLAGCRSGAKFRGVEHIIDVLRQYRHLNQKGVLNRSSAYHPFSCAVLFATMGLASVCTFPKREKRRIAAANQAAEAETVEMASELSLMDELENLAKLHEQGDLTDEEFQQEKEKILARM